MTIPLSTPSYNHYAGAGNLSLYPVTFPTFESDTVKVYVSDSDEWGHIDHDGINTILLDVGVDYSLLNIARPNTAVQLLDASDVPPGWVGPIPERQKWLDVNGYLISGYYLYIEFISNAVRPSVLSNGNQLIPALSRDLDRLAMHIKSLDHKIKEGYRYLQGEITGIEDSGSVIPSGGLNGDILGKASNADRDVEWKSFARAGFSTRYNQDVNFLTLEEFYDFHLDISYVPPIVSLSASGNTLREKGTPVTATTLSANVTKRSDDIAKIEFFQGAVSLSVMEPPANIGSGVTPYAWTGSFSDNTTFRVEVTDDGNSGGPTTVSASTTFSFVYPYYYGARPPAASGAQIAALTKDVISSTANVTRTFTAVGGDVFYFAYPNSYPALSSILDQNGFETIGSWTARTVTITGLDTTTQTYKVYEYNNVQAATTADFTFRR